MDKESFIQQHYARHATHFENDLVDEERKRISASWFDETTADYWRHSRAYECAQILAGGDTDSTWLTVGDGRWGLDSIRIRKKGFSSVMATDISEALLSAAREKGLIDEYAVENAERLSFPDNSFDYVFCKEALHHFPRPYVALYEMIRVARKAVFIIEPNDTYDVVLPVKQAAPRLGRKTRIIAGLRLLLRGIPPEGPQEEEKRPPVVYNPADWETSGNYVYAISRREIEKIALGLNLPQTIVKGLNDHYVKGCEFEPADENSSSVFRELVSVIRGKDELCRTGKSDSNLIMAGFFIEQLNDEMKRSFSDAGWDIADLPRNPYI